MTGIVQFEHLTGLHNPWGDCSSRCREAALECGDLAPLYGSTLVCVKLKIPYSGIFGFALTEIAQFASLVPGAADPFQRFYDSGEQLRAISAEPVV